MASPSPTTLVAIIVAICSDVFSGPVNAALTALFVVGRQRHLFADLLDAALLAGAVRAIIGTSVIAFLLAQSFWLAQGRIETRHWNGPGKVLLFPCRTSHQRKFPQAHAFSYSYLTIGIPVGFEGNAGGMVSVGAKSKHGLFSWLFGPPRGWFTVDAGDYLERGRAELGLRGKLNEYLRTQGLDPTAYPYAYLITAARFLGYHFNPVSFWYLYDADKRLVAMILEVNNTFDERRMYLLTPDDDCMRQADRSPRAEPNQTLKTDRNPRRAVFKESWPKDFHVSPFNSRKGSYRLTATDPLHPSMQGTGPLSATIALMSSKEHLKLVASLSSTGTAIDPCSMTIPQKMRFLSSWWWVGLLTFPRILAEAVRLFAQRNLHVWLRPEPLKGTINRRPTPTETQLEPIFRRYLHHLIQRSTRPLSITYHPAAGLGNQQQQQPQTFLSPVIAAAAAATTTTKNHRRVSTNLPTPRHHIDLHVLAPVFYTRFLRYSHHNREAFASFELDEDGCGATAAMAPRPGGLLLLLPLLTLGGGDGSQMPAERALCGHGFGVIRGLRRGLGGVDNGRGWEGVSGMDAYVMGCEAEGERAVYVRAVRRELLAERIAFGSGEVLGGMRVLGRVGLAWVVSGVVSGVLGSVVASRG